MRNVEYTPRQTEPIYTRRRFQKGIITLAAAGILYEARKGISFAPHNYNLHATETTSSELDQLSSDSFITIAHRAGNSIEGMEKAKKAGAKFAEGDMNKSGGKIYLDHGINKGLRGVVLGGFDRDTWTFRLGNPHLELKDGFAAAKNAQIGLFLELKRGNFTPKDIEKIYGLSLDHKVPLFIYSQDFKAVDMAREVTQKSDMCVYVPKDFFEWRKIFTEQDTEDRCSFLTNAWSASRYKDYISKIQNPKKTIVVMDADNSKMALALQTQGVANGLFNETGVLKDLFQDHSPRLTGARR